MLSSDQNVETLAQLFGKLRRYVELRLERIQLDTVSKMTLLLSTLLASAVLFVLGCIVVLFLSVSFALFIAPLVGSHALAFALVAAFYLLGFLFLWVNRQRVFVDPVVSLLSKVLLDEQAMRQAVNKDGVV